MKKNIKIIIREIFSRPIFQPFFEIILQLSLKILNIGEGHLVENSGEEFVFKILKKINSKDSVVVFDVGAHIGEWLKLFKKNYINKAHIYSFEPSKESYSELRKVTCENFTPEPIALGENSDIKYLYSNTHGSATSSIINKNKLKDTSTNIQEIQITTLDEYCNKNKITEIDLLKLDVEGYELKILSGSKNMIKNGKIKLIQFEFGAPSEEKSSLKDFFEILEPQYKIYRILKHGAYHLKSYHHYYEIMTVTNFLAIKK